MDKPLLNDPAQFPTDELLAELLKKSKLALDIFNKTINDEYPKLTIQWNYYNDGKSWLCKISKQKKTICWISIWNEFFKIVFYFTDKNSSDIQELEIVESLKNSFNTNKNIGKLRPLIVEVSEPSVLESVFILIAYKCNAQYNSENKMV